MTSNNYESVVDACVSSLMADIRQYNEDQLQALFNDEARLETMISDLPALRQLQIDREAKLITCKSLAESNLALEPRFVELRDRIQRAFHEAQVAAEEAKRLEAEVHGSESEKNLETVAAARKAEDESEAIADRFQEGSMSVDEFMKSFHEKRAVYHSRKVKSDKLNEILKQQQFRPVSQPVYPHPATGYRTSGANLYPNARHSYYN
ncbi:VPS37 C-terminal domain-containing protein [Aphelenchoides fujianensis]|nr:VPS37 C-terminal domain-containing protein [Aphelenchoides fujianensis]